MTALNTLQHLSEHLPATTAQALDLFDSLAAVDIPFMIGRWSGSGFATQHPMDGLLEAANWYGKEFVDADHVHPLLFSTPNGQIFKVAPNPTAMDLTRPLLTNSQIPLALVRSLSIGLTQFFKTDQSQARLRMMECRNVVSATMIYDHLPINDTFRKVDDHTVMGLMDYKAIPQPFFFVLRRDPASTL